MKRLIWTGLLLALLALTAVPARADTPYTTWARGPKGLLVMTQDAYTPLNEVDLPVSGPEDMFVTKEGVIYVADAGNGRIVRLDNNYEVVQSYGEEVLDNPTGIFVTTRARSTWPTRGWRRSSSSAQTARSSTSLAGRRSRCLAATGVSAAQDCGRCARESVHHQRRVGQRHRADEHDG